MTQNANKCVQISLKKIFVVKKLCYKFVMFLRKTFLEEILFNESFLICVIRDKASTYKENQSVYRNKTMFRFVFQNFGI